jgi:DNA-directed RNA polymerase subunit RPC12/RpoP
VCDAAVPCALQGNTPIPGATKPELKLTLSCNTYGERSYRCIRCKMVSRKVPYNAYHIKCGNCSTLFAYKDVSPDYRVWSLQSDHSHCICALCCVKQVEEYDKRIAAVKLEEDGLHKDRTALLASRLQMESFQNEKYAPVIADLNERLNKVEDKLQTLRERRIEIKMTAPNCNHYTDEGIYVCYVQNYRGGSMRMRRKSVGAVVVVEHSVPYLVQVSPVYAPRPQRLRKKWNVYSSIQGTFKRGRLEGLVVIRYQDGSFYEGPYISEDAIDLMGKTLPAGRPRNHYGVYRLADGRVFEGANVDNHFDPHNLNSYYRLTLPNRKGTYEGHFCDESYHGTGMFTYEDGSVYEGTWFRGSRFGHGHYRSAQGWTYEGFYDTSRRHRNGVINWPDGSCYLGEWYYDEIKGKGIYITALRDVYKGDMEGGLFHGQGEMIYADGSRYIGEFKLGMRSGRGVFTEREGNEYYGQFVDDLREGEHVCKLIIAIEVAGQDNFEIKVGLFNRGVLIKWKSKFSNPIATRQFIALFKKNREMFDSVFSMILAKNLPALPEGIDANNELVKQIVFKIRNEAGMLVGEHALNQARGQMKALLVPIKEKAGQIEQLKKSIEDMSVARITLEKDAQFYFHRYNDLMTKYEKDTQKIEQYWIDEPTEVRAVFQLACKALDTLTIDDYFSFRNHRTVPTFVKKIFDAISCLLDLSFDWAEQQFIIADAIANARNGDEDALRHSYKCKLAFRMKTYRVYDHVMFKEQDRLATILADSRFNRDSYYIQSTGAPGPILVDWIKTNYAYVRAAKAHYETLHETEQVKVKAFRFKATQAKKREEVEELGHKIESTHIALRKALDEQEELQHLLLKANDLLEFITGRYNFGQGEAKLDYYKLMEQRLEAQKDRFTIEVCLQGVINAVEERADKEKRARIREVLAMGIKWEEPVVQKPQIIDWITDEVVSQQAAILGGGSTLGYGFEPAATDVSREYTTQLISLIIDIVTGKLNDLYNDLAVAKSWLSMKGKTISSRFLYVLAWKVWQEQAVLLRDAHAVQAWESIFGTAVACARMAVEARISVRMSAVAREQAKVWAKCHPQEMRQAEEALSWEFEQEYGGATEDGSPASAEAIREVARQALAVISDESGTVPPSTKAACASWIRLHPEEMNVARDEQNSYTASLFEEQFPTGTAEVCFKVLNGWGNSEEMQWVEYAGNGS